MKKKIILTSVLLFAGINLTFADPSGWGSDDGPRKPNEPSNDTRLDTHLDATPVGTATTLLLCLGAGVLGYGLRKNSKKEE